MSAVSMFRPAVALAALALAGCAASTPMSDSDRMEARLRNVPEARVVGPARSCIRLAEVTNSEVRNDWTIDFERGSSRRIYRAELGNRCAGLNSARAFTYRTSLSELCTTEIIYPLHQTGGLNRGPGCGIARFIPMELTGRPSRRR